MTTAAMSMTHPRTSPVFERATVTLLLCFVASLQISIAAANILLSLMMVVWVAQMRPVRRAFNASTGSTNAAAAEYTSGRARRR